MKKILLFFVCSLALTFMSGCEESEVAGKVGVEEIILSKLELTIEANSEAVQLSATVKPDDAENKEVLWSVEDETVPGCVVVSEDGLVSGMSAGAATVVATAADGSMVTAECTVLVTPQIFDVEGIELQETATLAVGDVLELNYSVLPENATNKTLEWSVENASEAGCLEVNEEGIITAVAEGTATVVAKATDGTSVEAECEVTIVAATVFVSEIDMPETLNVKMGQTDVQIEYTVLPEDAENKEVEWIIQSETAHAAISLSEDGKVSAWAEGETVVVAKAKDGSGVTAVCKVISTEDKILMEKLSIPETLEIMAGTHQDIEVTIEPAIVSDKQFYWEVTDVNPQGCGYVDMTGRLWANKMGTLTLWCYSADGSELSASCKVTILDNTIYVNSIDIEEEMEVVVGEVKAVVVNSVLPEDAWDKTLVYAVGTASPEGCITVDAVTGEVTGVSAGTATVVVTPKDGADVSATCSVTVEEGAIPVSSIAVAPASNEIKQNSTFQYSATVLPENAADNSVVWSVENAAPAGCATIDAESGLLSAVSIGTATVVATAKDGSGVKGESALSIIDDKVYLTDITVPASINVAVGATKTVSVGFIPEDATNKNLALNLINVSPAGCVTLDAENMQVTGVAAGTAQVQVSTTDGTNITKVCELTISESESSSVYSIGDLYPDAVNPVGVVYYVENGGKNGKVVSLTQSTGMGWTTGFSPSNANSLTDGLENMAAVVAISGWESSYPLFAWVDSDMNGSNVTYTSGAKGVWYIPSVVEVRQLYAGMSGLGWRDENSGAIVDGTIGDWHDYDNEIWGKDTMTDYANYEPQREAFNNTILAAGGTNITYSSYWTSTEPLVAGTPSSFYKFTASMLNGSSNASEFASTQWSVRPVMQF